MDPVGFHKHDHSKCIQECLTAADEKCSDKGVRLTPVRRRTLEILLQDHRALGAYDLLDRLREEGLGSQPPVIYRALDFLTEHGFAHKIERLNAFVACSHPGESHAPSFLFCRECSTVAEAAHGAFEAIAEDQAKAVGFVAERVMVEIEGLCPDCRG